MEECEEYEREETRKHIPEKRGKTREYVARGNPDRKAARPSKNYGNHDDTATGKLTEIRMKLKTDRNCDQ